MAKSAVTAKDSRARAARPKKKRPRSVPAERLLKVGLAAVRTLTAGFVAASKLLVVSINGVAPAAGLSTNRPCTIIGVQGYGTTSCVVTCNLYGAASSAPTTINAVNANFQWTVTISNAVPAGHYLVEIVVAISGVAAESTTFGLNLT